MATYNQKYQNKYRIPSARAAWHDYGGGAYFVTVCTLRMAHYFGQVKNNEMILSQMGEYVRNNLQHVSEHYPYAEIPLFVVMPNHWHAIVFIDGDKTPYERRVISDVAVNNGLVIANQKGWLSVVIGGIKSAVTRYANQNNIEFAWQTRFHDHIIRDQDEMNRIAEYIEINPLTWGKDRYNT